MYTFIPAENVADEIAFERQVMEYRPTALVIARERSTSSFLLVQPEKEDSLCLWPVQGGIGLEETVEQAASRELQEEVNGLICPDWATVLGGMRYRTQTRDGYSQGKLLVAVHVNVSLDNVSARNVQVVPGEVKRIAYVPAGDVLQQMEENRVLRPKTHEKVEFLKIMYAHVLKRWP